MKVKDLIINLLDFDQDAEIFIKGNDVKYSDINLSWYSPSEGMIKKDGKEIYINVESNDETPYTGYVKDPNFMKLFKRFLVSEDDINDYISEWHDSDSELDLHEYLGMTNSEYKRYLEKDILER